MRGTVVHIKYVRRKSRLLYITWAKHWCHCCRTTEIKCLSKGHIVLCPKALKGSNYE